MCLLITWEDRGWVPMVIWQQLPSPVALYGFVAVSVTTGMLLMQKW